MTDHEKVRHFRLLSLRTRGEIDDTWINIYDSFVVGMLKTQLGVVMDTTLMDIGFAWSFHDYHLKEADTRRGEVEGADQCL